MAAGGGATADGRDAIASGGERAAPCGRDDAPPGDDGHSSDAAGFASNGSRCEQEDDVAEVQLPQFLCEECRFEWEWCLCKEVGGRGIHLERLFDAAAVKGV